MTDFTSSYKLTIKACYLGLFVQATVINLTPVLFIPLREQFGFSFSKLGLLVLINFITQVVSDILFSHVVDRHGYRRFLVWAHIGIIAGFSIFAISPFLLQDPYSGFVLGTLVFSAAGGLLEVLLSPVVHAIPSKAKSASMSLLHSFYAWGQMAVVILTTLFLFAFGRQAWPVIVLLWTIPPLMNAFLFSVVPFAPIVPDEHRQGYRTHIRNRFFIVAVLAIGFGGAAEVIMNQWASAFMEKVMLIPKVIGDVAGMSMFAFMLGLGRLLHGKFGHKFDLYRIMMIGCAAAFVCYVVVSLSGIGAISILACGICGIAVSLLWPGTLVLTSERFPLAGTWLFAFLAAGGDIGAAAGPWLVGIISDNAIKVPLLAGIGLNLGLDQTQLGMRIGILIGSLFPLAALLCLGYMKRARQRLPLIK
ncbi:MAG: MFS transporter [Clostridia bacterium]